VVSAIAHGLCLLVGIEDEDDESDIQVAVEKIAGLRVFADDQAKMNLSVADVAGEVLVVSQFTLAGDVRRGRRPSFSAAARPEEAEPLITAMVGAFNDLGIGTKTGVFGAAMDVELVNDGPVTLVLDVRNATLS
jgi:D-tyrosyl-tRNA(Tyr) deacylase